jgi:hypothetical protein
VPTRLSDMRSWSKRLTQAGPLDIQNAGSCDGSDVYQPGSTIVVDSGEFKEEDRLAAVLVARLGNEEEAQKSERMDPELSWALDAPEVSRGELRRVESGCAAEGL